MQTGEKLKLQKEGAISAGRRHVFNILNGCETFTQQLLESVSPLTNSIFSTSDQKWGNLTTISQCTPKDSKNNCLVYSICNCQSRWWKVKTQSKNTRKYKKHKTRSYRRQYFKEMMEQSIIISRRIACTQCPSMCLGLLQMSVHIFENEHLRVVNISTRNCSEWYSCTALKF